MGFDTTGYRTHVAHLRQHWEEALGRHDFDAAMVPAGAAGLYYDDDQAPPFHPNPQFARWFPDDDCQNAALLVRPGERPKLYFRQAEDYWHLPPTIPDWADEAFEVETHGSQESLTKSLGADLARIGRTALVGPSEAFSSNLGEFTANPEPLVNHVVFGRAEKTPFEIARLREASLVGARGHLAARDAFYDGGSEFDIHMAYLRASSQLESKLPYQSIIGLNEHSAILHYQHYDRQRPDPAHSFLIDAGGRAAGYHSDITRSYSAESGNLYDQLIAALDEQHLALIGSVRSGLSFNVLHERMHVLVGAVLSRFGLVRCSAESAFEQRITDAFFPHGLGHLLGLQTHDVGGRLENPEGGLREPAERFPTLRYTRTLAPGHVFTIEPGMYCIPMLLRELAASDAAKDVDWQKVDSLRPFGGIRIEDNILLTADGVENLTRQAFAELGEV